MTTRQFKRYWRKYTHRWSLKAWARHIANPSYLATAIEQHAAIWLRRK